jgi:hypothetical protein
VKESGVLISTDLDRDGETHRPTHSCCHCGYTWVWRKGSGKKRGVCLLCNGHTCGKPECDRCVPLEQWIENVESGRPEDYKPVVVSFAAPPPPPKLILPGSP